jgi:hypothetical protein
MFFAWGMFRISLTYDEATGTGKTTAYTDMGYGRFLRPVPNEQVVEVMVFETANHAIRVEMTVTFNLTHCCGRSSDRAAMWHGETPATARAYSEGIPYEQI